MRVLIVDDSQLVRMLLQEAITDLGNECLTARDGNEAWTVLQTHDCDVVVSDWMMPGLNGYELCHRVRTRADAPYVYFVFLTVLRDAGHAVAGMKAGADDYLSKPVDPAELATTLYAATRIVGLHRKRQALLQIARELATASDTGRLLSSIAERTRTLLDADSASVYRVQDDDRSAVRVAVTQPEAWWPERVVAESSGLGACLSDRGARSLDAPGGPSVLAAPLVHAGRMLGLLCVGNRPAERPFDGDAGEILEILAAMTAAVLINLERAELVKVTLAAHELAHLLNNKLGIAVGTFDLLEQKGNLPDELQEMMAVAAGELDEVAEQTRQFQRLTQGESKLLLSGQSSGALRPDGAAG